ncbi:MAG: CHAT domain-containing protein, partial [Nitrospirae bacterium]
SSSLYEALIKAYTDTGIKDGWIELGYRGMTPEEAKTFAEEHFTRYVEEAVEAYNNGHFLKALSLFEDAIIIAEEVSDYAVYLPQLYQYSRESAYMGGDKKKALLYAEKLVKLLSEKAPNTDIHAEALLRVGILYAQMEHFEKSVSAIEKSLKIIKALNKPIEEVMAFSNMGIVLERATEYDRALKQFEIAAKLSKKLGKKELLSQQYTNIGRIYDLRLSQYARAIRYYEKALTIYRQLGRDRDVAQALLNIGRCYRLLGNFQKAQKYYDEAMELVSPSDLILKAKITIELANNAWFQAKYQEAFTLQKQVYGIAKKQNWTLGKVMAMNTSGLIWWTLGDNKRALRDIEEALETAHKLSARPDEVATTLNNKGLIYREMGRYKEALETFEKALTIDRRIKSKWAIAYDLRNKGLTLFRMGDYKEAKELFREAASEAASIGNRINEAKSLLALGMSLIKLGDEQHAEEVLQKALKLAESMAMKETQWRCLFELSKISLIRGNRDEAIELLKKAIDIIEKMRADIKVEQMKEGFITNKMAVYETLVSLLVDKDNIEGAFNVAERSRARNFIDLLGNQRLSLAGVVEQKLYERQIELRNMIEEHEILLAQAINEEEKKVYSQALERLQDSYRDLMLEIQLKHPELSSLVSVNPLTLRDVQELLEPKVSLLVYYVLPNEIMCWIVNREGVDIKRIKLSRKTLKQLVFDYRRMLQNLEPLEDTSKQLYDLLISPVIPEIKGSKYVGIIPHGVLHYLSFVTLNDGKDYLIDKYPLFYLPSASVFKYTVSRRSEKKNVKVLAIGNPDLGDPRLELPFAEYEVGSIKWNFPEITILTRERATESWVVKHIKEFGIIHIASHGEFDPVNPLFSAVKLKRDLKADGDLEAVEVFGLEINADLVVLSACQSGLSKVTDGDEIIGLNRAFFYAGTHAIVSSLWRISDVSTAMLIKQFYRNYTEYNKADSLRRAMIHVRNWYRHPGYWGAFIIAGDYY